jgi:putative membrane protein
MKHTIFCFSAAFSLLAVSALAADTAKIDQHVLSKMHHGNKEEIELSKLAAGRSETNGVKEIADQMIQGHGKADLLVKMTAKKAGVKLQEPVVPENDDERQAAKNDKAEIAKLKSLKGADFDAEYESYMIAAHQKTIAELNTVLPQVGPETHDLIQKLLPDFQMHLDMFNKLKNPQ